MNIISPTGLGMRSDAKGAGYFGAPRAGRKHRGYDFECVPGQEVICPIENAVIVRIARPYATHDYEGAVIASAQMTIKIFYVDILEFLIGKQIKQGDMIGLAQDISNRYGPQMTPHVHLAIVALDPAVLLNSEGPNTPKNKLGGNKNGITD
jgi:hypothetical protein